MAIKFERMLIGDTFHCCHCYYWWRSLIISYKVSVSHLLPQNHEERRKQPQTDSWHFRLILTRFSPGFIINRVQIKLMYRHSIDSTNSIHINVLVVFANGCSVLCRSSGSSWLEIPVNRWCIRCTNKLMTSNTLRYKKAASNNSQAITVERACTTAKHKKCTVHVIMVDTISGKKN